MALSPLRTPRSLPGTLALTSLAPPRAVAPLGAVALGVVPLGVALAAAPALAGPVVCTTTLEAPLAGSGPAGMNAGGPVEVTRCAAVETTSELVERRFYSYTAPYARGVDLTHQITDLFGIAMGGGDGTKVMGFGFPDQTIVWDGSALQNTYQVLLEQQSDPMPWRTADVPNGFSSSLGAGGASPMPGPWQEEESVPTPQLLPQTAPATRPGRPVRGLW